ncbi:uncharacterized protein APUU_10242A [Aspergillus puulaauensis]|uniref:Uncharacterized protein n=1 Tax=Aspergillus puulaauensis TaxID=1220207 RepID=A0A7R7XB26_9EURO|nr:uncharacterized protein APUU_10242A [Aspergillus puulaauensis]BCS17414.1 hypothetical protein APUU_10242A [Aspergillus puulaauensis]
MKLSNSSQIAESAACYHNAATLFSQELTPEPSDDEDIVYQGRKGLDRNGRTIHTSKVVSGETADDWFIPGAEDPVPSNEGVKTELKCEDDPLAFLSEYPEDDDFFFGPPLDLITRARAIEDAYNQRLFEPPLKASARLGRTHPAADKENADSKVIHFTGRDEMPESPLNSTILAWLNETEIPTITTAVRPVSQVKVVSQKTTTKKPDTKAQRQTDSRPSERPTNQVKAEMRRQKNRSKQLKTKTPAPNRPLPPLPVSTISQPTTTMSTDTESTTKKTTVIKQEPENSPAPTDQFAFPSCKGVPSKGETIVNPAADPRRQPRPLSPASPGRRPAVPVITCHADQEMADEAPVVPPAPTKSVISEYTGPIYAGRGPFWAAQYKDTETHTDNPLKHRPTKSLTRDEALEELDRANKRIWELEIDASRSAWKLGFADDQLRDFDEALNRIGRLENTIRRLQAEKACAVDHLDLLGEEIRRLKERSEWDAWQLEFAQQKIRELEGGERSSVYLRKRKWESPSLSRSKRAKANDEDYLRRRETWQERKNTFWAETVR